MSRGVLCLSLSNLARARAHARPPVWGMACLPSAGQWRYNSGPPEGCWCCSCARLMENWDLGFITNLVRNHWNLPCETWLRCICLGLCLDLDVTGAVKAAFSKHYFWLCRFILEILTPKQQPRKRASACENTLWCFGLHKHIKGWKTVPRARSDALNVLVHSVHLICWAYWCSRWNILHREILKRSVFFRVFWGAFLNSEVLYQYPAAVDVLICTPLFFTISINPFSIPQLKN